MKKRTVLLLLFCLAIITIKGINHKTHAYARENEKYKVYVDDLLNKSFETYKEALYYSYLFERVYILNSDDNTLVYHNDIKYIVSSKINPDSNSKKFYELKNAIAHAKKTNGQVKHIPSNKKVWENNYEKKNNSHIEVVKIKQFPELPRGCSIVSLAMLLNHAGITDVDKMRLNEEIYKQDIKYELSQSEIFFADPYYGFVGEVSTFEEAGLGVYFPAVYELASKYLGERSLNLSGTDMEDLFYFLDNDYPIWTMVNAKYVSLGDEDYITWKIKKDGGREVEITKWMHSVLITGYDDKYIYINDPLQKQEKIEKEDFIEAYNQMGKQALSYIRK